MYKFVVLSCFVAVASAGALISPLAYSAPYGYEYSPLTYTVPIFNPSNYRGPLSLAPGQPANILGADGRPLDTLDVNLDRSAHLAAKAFGGHVLKKRSAGFPFLPAPAVSNVGLAAPYLAPAPVINPGFIAQPVRTFPYAANYAQYAQW